MLFKLNISEKTLLAIMDDLPRYREPTYVEMMNALRAHRLQLTPGYGGPAGSTGPAGSNGAGGGAYATGPEGQPSLSTPISVCLPKSVTLTTAAAALATRLGKLRKTFIVGGPSQNAVNIVIDEAASWSAAYTGLTRYEFIHQVNKAS